MKKGKNTTPSVKPKTKEHVPHVAKAQQRYARENQDIGLAVEAMRRAQLVHEARTKNLIDSLTYRVVHS